jgi:hypothetical protein
MTTANKVGEVLGLLLVNVSMSALCGFLVYMGTDNIWLSAFAAMWTNSLVIINRNLVTLQTQVLGIQISVGKDNEL